MLFMLVDFLHSTQKYQKAILGLIVISMILVMSQISQHGFMLQQKATPTQQQLSISTNVPNTEHCVQSSQDTSLAEKINVQCQTYLSVSDSSSENTTLSIVFPDFNSGLFVLSNVEVTISSFSRFQLNTYNYIIHSLFPSIAIKLHSFLI